METDQNISFMPVSDPLMMTSKLDEIANEFIDDGYMVERRGVGIVVVHLDDGEVHFIPGNAEIRRIIFKKRVEPSGQGRLEGMS